MSVFKAVSVFKLVKICKVVKVFKAGAETEAEKEEECLGGASGASGIIQHPNQTRALPQHNAHSNFDNEPLGLSLRALATVSSDSRE